MTLVWDLQLSDSEKIVLLALADCANDEGHCWPGMASLTRKCSKSERTIQGAIKSLCDSGHLTRREVLGKGCNYTVHPRRDCTPAETAPPQPLPPTPAVVAGKPSRTINKEAKASYMVVIDHWNECSKKSGIPEVRVVNHSRKQMILARVKEHGLAKMLEAVDNVHGSPFCRGETGDGRKADINLILQPKTLPRVLEGFYGSHVATAQRITDPEVLAINKRATADLYDKMGRSDEAAQLRREADALSQTPKSAKAA